MLPPDPGGEGIGRWLEAPDTEEDGGAPPEGLAATEGGTPPEGLVRGGAPLEAAEAAAFKHDMKVRKKVLVTFAWVTRPEHPKGAKDEVKRPDY